MEMNKKKKYINYPKERALLSDVLPYELPITFSNRYLYRFLVNNKVEINNRTISSDSKFLGDNKIAFDYILTILFSKNLLAVNDRKIPFTYRISHKDKDFRELALIHPLNQLLLVEFYEKYKELILHFCSVSNYSIRKPDQIAKFTYFNDKLHQSNKGESNDFLELSGKEYENLKTFFSYRKYTNIYRFYEDYRYQRAEKKYNKLFKFDIGRCFDSIYTHSIAWATLGIDSVKENVSKSKHTFSGEFDHFIQYSNYGETNGILIGPEFSRIFAEIILQRIDKNIEDQLKKKGIFLKVNYELYRYVDDYFLFYDDANLKEEILTMFKHELKIFKLSINDAKSKDYDKPIITEITIAKNEIIRLLNDHPKFVISEIEKPTQDFEFDSENADLLKYKFHLKFDSNKFIAEYKSIIKKAGVDYKDVLNFSLALLNNKIERNLVDFYTIFLDYANLELQGKLTSIESLKKLSVERAIIGHLENFLDIVFFLYSVSPRVNSTIKVCHILSKIIKFLKEKIKFANRSKYVFSDISRERVFKKILDEASFILNKNCLNEFSKVESLYLITVLRDLGKEHSLGEKLLAKFLTAENNSYLFKSNTLNYFSIVVPIYYIGHSQKYNKLKKAILEYSLSYVKEWPIEKRGKSSEIVHLLLDMLACPYVDFEYKKKLLFLCRVTSSYNENKNLLNNAKLIIDFHKHHKYWFTRWDRFDLAKELENKKSQEVYS